MRKVKFFKFVRIRFEKRVSEVRKKWKTNFWNLVSGKKMANFFFQEMRTGARRRSFFFSFKLMMHKGEVFKMVRVAFETQVSEIRNKSEKLTFEVSIWVKNLKFIIFQKRHARSTGGKICSGYYQKMRQAKLFKGVRITFEKFVSDVQKKRKANALNLDVGEEPAKLFFFKCVLAPEEVIFF